MLEADGPVNRIAIMKKSVALSYRATPYMLSRKPRKAAWLARLCWRTLHRLGALEVFREKVEVFTYTEAQQNSVKKVMEAAYSTAGFHDKPMDDLAFFMGAEEFGRISHRSDVAEWGMFTVSAGEFRFNQEVESRDPRLRDPMHRYITKVYNVPVHVVPWLKGVAVVPKIYLEVKVAA